MQTALILIDVQQSFKHRPYWRDTDVPAFLERTNALLAGAAARGVPVVRVFHVDEEPAGNPFSMASGLIRPLDGLAPYDPVFTTVKHRHLRAPTSASACANAACGGSSSPASAPSSAARRPPATPATKVSRSTSSPRPR
jgi:nicotinamidase-related amidase